MYFRENKDQKGSGDPGNKIKKGIKIFRVTSQWLRNLSSKTIFRGAKVPPSLQRGVYFLILNSQLIFGGIYL